MTVPILAALAFLPLLGVPFLFLVPRQEWVRPVGVATSGLVLAVAVAVAALFDWSSGGLQLQVRATWIPALGASFFLGVDGISLPLALLTALLTFLALLFSAREESRTRAYYALFLFMEVGLLGLFSALDLLLFYVFWEVAIVPMYFIIAIWGHGRRRPAALQFFLYTRVSALALLLAILGLYLAVTPHTFDLVAIVGAAPFLANSVSASLILAGFFVAFVIKLPVVPFHSWLPDAHTEAPTAGSVILAGLLLKMGGYGFLRLALPTVPGAMSAWALALGVLAVLSAVYGALVAMGQADLKRLVAYSSINHMGYVLLAVAVAGAAYAGSAERAIAVSGAVYQLVAHGLATGGLFFLVGMLSARTGTREIARLSGVWQRLPAYGTLFTLVTLASVGLPPLVHFAGEFQIVLGTVGVYVWDAVGMLVGVFVTTALFIWTLQRVLLGRSPGERAALQPLLAWEFAVIIPLVFLIIALGVAPGPLTGIVAGALRSSPVAPPIAGR